MYVFCVQLLQEFSKRAWDPKVQIPYKVDSGKTPRKVEMERRRRQYARQAGTIDGLLHELKVSTQDLMPVADHTARALLDFSGKGHPTPTFPSFLPLEVFDNTEFDCRTPEEWVALGEPVCLSACSCETLFCQEMERYQLKAQKNFSLVTTTCELRCSVELLAT